MTGKTATQRILNIATPDGTNGAAAIKEYDPTADTPHTTIAPSNIAVLTLETPLVLDNSKFHIILINFKTYKKLFN